MFSFGVIFVILWFNVLFDDYEDYLNFPMRVWKYFYEVHDLCEVVS